MYNKKFIFLISASFLFLVNCSYTSFQTAISENQTIKDWFLSTKYGVVEASITWPSDNDSYPSLLIIQSSDENNQKNTKELLSLIGYPIIAMSISLPGIGNSTGPHDFGGKKSVESIKKAIHYLSEINNNGNKSIFIYANGFGANAAIIATRKVSDVKLLILENGLFEPRKVIKKSPQNLKIRLKDFLSHKNYKANFRSSLYEIEKNEIPIIIIRNIRGKDYELEQHNEIIKFLKLKNKKYKILDISEKNKSLFFQKLIIKKRVVPIIEKYFKKTNSGKILNG